MTPPTTARRAAAQPVVSPVVAAERQRVRDLRQLGHERNVDASLVDAMIDAGTPVESARRSIVVGEDRSALQPFATFGEQLRAIRQAETTQSIDPRLRVVAAASGLNEGLASEGGFLVQPDFAQQILERAWNFGQILRRVRRYPVPIGRNGVRIQAFDEKSRADGQRLGGVVAYWLGEADTITASKPKVRRLEQKLKKLIALCYLTDELDSDSPAASASVLDAFAQEISFMTEDAIVNGLGGATPLGITKSGALIKQAIEPTQTIANSGTFLGTNVTKMFARCFASRDPSAAAWLVNAELLPLIQTVVVPSTSATAVAELFNFDGPGSIGYGTLCGRPVIPAEYCAAVGTPGDLILTDLAEYLLADQEPGQMRSIHVRFLQDENVYRIVYRVDGQPIWSSAVTPRTGSNTVSPYVVLDTRA